MQDVLTPKADFYLKAAPPLPQTLHNPLPAGKASAPTHMITALYPSYTPYIGTLQNHITKLIEANETVPPYNFAFLLVTNATLRYVDPRPRKFWVTEIEHVWSGPSARYWQHNQSLLSPGLEMP